MRSYRSRMIVGCLSVLLAAACPAMAAKGGDQANEAAYLAQAKGIIIGPFLTPTDDLATSVGVGWVTKEPGVGEIEYGSDRADGKTVKEDQPTTDHFILLTGLTPGATYRYRVKTGELASKEYSFLTSPPDGKFTMLIGADWHFQSYKGTAYAQQRTRFGYSYPDMLKAAPNVVFIQGDNAESTISSVYNMYESCRDMLASAVFIPVIGNHDWSEEGTKIFKHLSRFPGGLEYGSFVYGRVHVISDRQMDAAWLTKACQAAEDKADWRVYGKHHPLPYSHTKQSGPGAVSKTWLDLTAKHPVDFAFFGHRHQFERSYPVRRNPYDPSAWGVVASSDTEKYFNIRGATIWQQSGSMWYGFTNAIPDLYHAPKKGIKYDDGAWQTFTVLNFDGKVCKYATHACNRNSQAKKIIDQFTIDNTGSQTEQTPKIASEAKVEATGYEAVISFTTDIPARAVARFGTAPGQLALQTPTDDVNPMWVTDHKIQLNCLKPETTYYYVVEAGRDTQKVAAAEGTFKTGASRPGMQVGKFDFGFVAYGAAAGAVKDVGHPMHKAAWFGWDKPANSLAGASQTELGNTISDAFAAELMCMTRDGVWTVRLPDGKYDLEITSGGQSWRATPYKISVQKDQAVLTFAKPQVPTKAAAAAAVTDGRLTLRLEMADPKDRYGSAKINLLVIKAAE